MAGPTSRKRDHKEIAPSKLQRPKKKQKKSREYHSDSEEENTNPNFQPVNLLDSDDEDLENIAVDDAASFSGSSSDSGSDIDAGSRSRPAVRQRKPQTSNKTAKDDSNNDESGEQDSIDEYDDDDEDDEDDDDDGDADRASSSARSKKSKSKRNDPDAFATSMSKILNSKLSGARKADPVLSRNADAHQAAKDAVDAALEAKARKYLRERKRAALEKGRVRDVLAAGGGASGGEPETSTAEVVQTEKRLRKVAHRGVVMLFRAVREAQERAFEADRDARKDGIFGVGRREEKVNEMSRQGFLDLIAGGGGKSKMGGLEEA